jgi:hypothetical protein
MISKSHKNHFSKKKIIRMAMASLIRTYLLRSIRPMSSLTKAPLTAKTFTVTPMFRVAPTRLDLSLPVRSLTATSFRFYAVPAPSICYYFILLY